MIQLTLTQTYIESVGHGNDETCSRVSQFLYDIEIMYFLINKNLYQKMKDKGLIIFEKGHTLISWDYTLDYTLRQFITFVSNELHRLYPSTINFIEK